MAENKPSSREQVKQIVAGIEQGIQDLFQSEKFADYLRTMSRFHSYSYNNTILIHMQMPSATQVAGFNKWKNQFGRHVKKGEKGLTIIAPTPFKKKIEEMKLDPDTKAPMLDQDGNAIIEEREIEIPLFRPVKVFDVSQTEGKPLPSLVSDLTGDVQQYEAFMEALRRASPVPMEVKPIEQSMDGFFSNATQSITIRAGMSEVQTVCAAVHEMAHSILHNREKDRLTAAAGDTDKEQPKAKDKNTMEVEAESVSYAVCQYYGIETGANSLGYIATWSRDRTLPELKASLETITKTVNGLITSIDKHFEEVCKERGIDLTVQQAEQAVSEPPAPEQPEIPAASQPEQGVKLDEYPMPDTSMSMRDIAEHGYNGGDLLPLSRERAAVLLEQDLTVYTVQTGENPEMVFDRDDLMEQPESVIFAIPRGEWEESPDFRQSVADRMNHQEDREQAFLGHAGDCFAIYQVASDDPQNIRFMNMEWLNSKGIAVERSSYDLIYTGELATADSVGQCLESLYEKFNLNRPADYLSPSLSVSDIVAIKRDGVLSCHYCDSIGFAEVPDFIKPEHYLKNAELAMEDDCSMVDGLINNGPKEGPTVAELEAQVKAGQSISLMDLAGAVHREQGEKPKKSVLDQLKSQPRQEQKKTAPKRSAEMEL